MRYKPLDSTNVVGRAKDYIWKERNFRRLNLTAAMVADELGIARSSFINVFSKEMNLSFLDYVNDCRVRYSRKLVMQNHGKFPMEHIQMLSGFGSLHSFYTKYKEKYGELPSETDAQRIQ